MRDCLAIAALDPFLGNADNLTARVDRRGPTVHPTESAKIAHATVLPQKRVPCPARDLSRAHDLAAVIDGIGGASSPAERSKIAHSALAPEETVHGRVGRLRPSDNFAAFVDRRGRRGCGGRQESGWPHLADLASQRAEIGQPPPLPVDRASPVGASRRPASSCDLPAIVHGNRDPPSGIADGMEHPLPLVPLRSGLRGHTCGKQGHDGYHQRDRTHDLPLLSEWSRTEPVAASVASTSALRRTTVAHAGWIRAETDSGERRRGVP